MNLAASAQIRYGAKATRVQIVQDILGRSASLSAGSLSGPLPEIDLKLERGEQLSPEEVSVWRAYLGAGPGTGRCSLAPEGMIEPDLLEAYDSRYGTAIRRPPFRPLCERHITTNFPPKFREHVECQMNDAAQQGVSADWLPPS